MSGLLCLGDYSAKWIIHRNTYIPTGVNITPDFVPQVVSADYGVIYVGIQYLVYFSGVKMTPVFGGRTNRTKRVTRPKSTED